VPHPPSIVEVSKEEIGRRLKTLRRDRNLTQTELAEMLGTHFTAISQIERGIRGLTIHQVVRLAKALRVDPNALLGTGTKRRSKEDLSEPRSSNRLLKRLQRIEELPAAQRRIVLGVLDSLLKTHGRNGTTGGR